MQPLSVDDKIIIDLTLVRVRPQRGGQHSSIQGGAKEMLAPSKMEQLPVLPAGNRFFRACSDLEIYANLNLIWLNCLPRQRQPCKCSDKASLPADGLQGALPGPIPCHFSV